MHYKTRLFKCQVPGTKEPRSTKEPRTKEPPIRSRPDLVAGWDDPEIARRWTRVEIENPESETRGTAAVVTWCRLVKDFGKLFSMVAGQRKCVDEHRSTFAKHCKRMIN